MVSKEDRAKATREAARDLTNKAREARGEGPVSDREWQSIRRVAANLTSEIIDEADRKRLKGKKKT